MTPRTKQWLTYLLRFVVAAGVLVAFAFFVRDLDWRSFLQAMRQASLGWVLLAIALNFAQLYWKAVRWRMMLPAQHKVSVWRLFRYTITGYAASTILPARLGEVVRVWLLKQREGVPATTSTAVALGEKGLEVMTILLITAPIPWLLPSLPPWVGRAILLLALAGAVILIATLALAHWMIRRRTAGRLPARAERFLHGIEIFADPRGLLLLIGISLVTWATDAVEVVLILWAVGIHAPWAAALLVILVVNAIIAVPSTPGQMGAFEVASLIALDLLGVPRPQALAFALVYHGMQVLPLAVIGLFEIRLVRELRASQPATESAAR